MREIGIIWSTVALMGSGYLRDLSTGFPQMPHILCVASIIFLFASNCARCGPFRSGRVLELLPMLSLYSFSRLTAA